MAPAGTPTPPRPRGVAHRAPLPGAGGPGCHDRGVTRPALLPVSAALTACLLLAGCGDGTASASSSATLTPAPNGGAEQTPAEAPATTGEEDGAGPGGGGDAGGDAGTAAPPFPADASPDTAEASADALVTVTDVRTGRHDGFDRVVFEVGGTGTPGWDVRYVDVASSQGRGDVVEVAGGAVLQVSVTGAGYPFDTGVEEYAGPDPLPGQGTATVTEVVFDATFEGTTVAFVGTRAEAPFRVYLLQDPARVVVEVADQR